MPIYFYSDHEAPYGAFSNFSKHGFTLDGKYWKTSEHYFQAQKFVGTPHEEEVRNAPAPKDAADWGRQRSRPLRTDWEEVKDDVMRRALHAKFTQHPTLPDLLLGTGDEEIVENAPGDYYWGCGKDGSGRNRLGALLMELRTALRREAEEKTTKTTDDD
ncbi:MAG: NADAR family protein [Nannocystis sp.]|nr:NADAR family protein [Nannocystis sp.]MBA3545807.1 NADAR family protein [Nannocystis sp.]